MNITIDPKIYKLNYTNSTNINNNTYTWYLDKNNCNDGEIILTLDKINKMDNEIINPDNSEEDKKNQQNKKNDYTIYIFCGILIILILLGYHIFKKMKNKSESFDLDD